MPPVVQLYTRAVLGLRESEKRQRYDKVACVWLLARRLAPGARLWTAVYQPAARVRLMTTSTGIRSATASLLARMVRRIPLPA